MLFVAYPLAFASFKLCIDKSLHGAPSMDLITSFISSPKHINITFSGIHSSIM